MAAMSDYLENALLSHILKNTPLTSPATVYLALFTSDPTDANTGAEVPGLVGGNPSAYARVAITFGTVANGTVENSADITFAVATQNWGTITHIGIMDASTAGNLLFHGALTSSKTVATGDQFKIAVGDLDVTLN